VPITSSLTSLTFRGAIGGKYIQCLNVFLVKQGTRCGRATSVKLFNYKNKMSLTPHLQSKSPYLEVTHVIWSV
jgi:hypothetical protein